MSKNRQLEEIIAVLEAVAALAGTSGFAHYTKLIEAEIAHQTPSVTRVGSGDEAIEIASKMAYITGLKKALSLATDAHKRLADFRKSLAQRQGKQV